MKDRQFLFQGTFLFMGALTGFGPRAEKRGRAAKFLRRYATGRAASGATKSFAGDALREDDEYFTLQ